MKTEFHPAQSRGHQDHGWLKANHSFSFANWYNPKRMNFGALRVLNDDFIAAERGFGTHPHDNMEIITLPLKGKLTHRDSMGHSAVISAGDIQVISAGTGIYHSEQNEQSDEAVELLQLWIFPNQKDVQPRYDQITIRKEQKENDFYQIISPYPEDAGSWIHQNAWLHLGDFKKASTANHQLNDPNNGLYVFVIEGSLTIGQHQLQKRDALGLWEIGDELVFQVAENSLVLLIEVPLQF